MAEKQIQEPAEIPLPNETAQEVVEKPIPPIAAAINSFLHRTRDIETAAKAFIPASAHLLIKLSDETRRELDDAMSLLEKDDDVSIIMGLKISDKALRRLDRLNNSKLPWVLENSLFLGLFSAYDAFTGDLLSAIYNQKPELYTKMERTISVQEALQCKSFDDLKNSVLSEEIESFRRESYVQHVNCHDIVHKNIGHDIVQSKL
jgi:hypothetical protein